LSKAILKNIRDLKKIELTHRVSPIPSCYLKMYNTIIRGETGIELKTF